MSYCGECQHWERIVSHTDDNDCIGKCEICQKVISNMRHGCIMFAQGRNITSSASSPIDRFRNNALR